MCVRAWLGYTFYRYKKQDHTALYQEEMSQLQSAYQAGMAWRRRMTPASANNAAEASSLYADHVGEPIVTRTGYLHLVTQVIHNFLDACLNDFDGTLETRASGGGDTCKESVMLGNE